MTYTTADLRNAATDALSYFTTLTRDDGTEYVALFHTPPRWLSDAVQAAHDREMPNDWRYAMARRAVQAIADGDLIDGDTLHEHANLAVSTRSLLLWLAEDLSRMEYVDRARREYGPDDLATDLIRAHYLAVEHTAEQMLEHVREHVTTVTN